MSDEETIGEIRIRPVRQWVTLRQGSLDTRLGDEVLDKVARELKSAVGTPGRALIVHAPELAAEHVEMMRRMLTDEGFLVDIVEIEGGRAGATLEAAAALWDAFVEHGITSDDGIVAMGDETVLSVASFACGHWLAGVPLAEVATDLHAIVSAPITPRALDYKGVEQAISHATAAKMTLADPRLVEPAISSDEARLAVVRMAAMAICEDEKAFGRFWDRAQRIADNDAVAIYDQLADSLRSRGRVASNSSVAVRQSTDFGFDIARALRTVAPDEPEYVLLAEAIRIAARLGVALDKLSFDDMLAIDELFEMLEVPEIEREIDAERLTEAIREQRFSRARRLMLLIPHALGRVRLTSIDDELLAEHVSAWCDARAPEDD